MESQWIDKENYWFTKEQLSDFWHKARICRVTGSRLGGFVGHSIFTNPEKTAREITGIFKNVPSFSSQKLMKRGIIVEPYAREWYARQNNIKIEEIGLAVPKWDVRFGSSVDGIIGNEAICEIKVPYKMYEHLKQYSYRKSLGETFDKFYHDHIWSTHYDQMQLGMAVTGTKFCHYIVFLPEENDLKTPQDTYCEIIPFNSKYWKKLYTLADKNYKELIIPLMEKYNIVRLDPPLSNK